MWRELDAHVKGDIFRRTIYPPSLIVIALIDILGATEVGRIPPSPRRRRRTKAWSK